MSVSEQETAKELGQYLAVLRVYLRLIKEWDPFDINNIKPTAEKLRRKLLLDRNRMMSLVGDIPYSQFGEMFSAWDALNEGGLAGPDEAGLWELHDGLVARWGELEESGAKEWRIYEVTNPLFWVVRLWEWLWSALRWSCARLAFAGLWSRTAKIIYFAAGFVAAIATIASVILKATGTW